MKKLILMSGIPGCGKSTWAKKYAERNKNVLIVSRDEVRFALLKEGEEYFSREKEVFRYFIQYIEKGFELYDEVIADATHISPASRRKLLNALNGKLPMGVEIDVVVIESPLEKALEQNELRKEDEKRYVPRSVIRRMYEQYEKPTEDEGFDRIYFHKIEEGKTVYKIIECTL